jgi:hypothetical protein
MRRALAVTAALGLIGVSALTARADSPKWTIPECANVQGGLGTYDPGTGALHMEVRLRAEPCDGAPVSNEDGSTTTTTVDYDLYVIKDKTWSGDPANPDRINILNLLGPMDNADQVEFVSADYSSDPLAVTQFTAPGVHVITYDVVVPDDDPTVCVFSHVHGSTVTTREVQAPNQPEDQNGNGSTNDDTHNGNGGETNKDKQKFDWGTSTTTEQTTVDFWDRAPSEDVDSGEAVFSSTACLPIDALTTLVDGVAGDLVGGSSGGQGYN